MISFLHHIRTISSKIFVAGHLRGVDLRGARAGGGEVTAGEFRDLPGEGAVGGGGEAGAFVAQGEDNKGVCVEAAVVQELEAATSGGG